MARSRVFRRSVVVLTAVCLLGGAAFAQRSGRRAAAGQLRMVPRDALFCVKVSGLEQTAGLIDEFLDGVAPPDMRTEQLLGKLKSAMGAGALENVRKRGQWMLFGTALPGSEDNPMANFFVGLLVPVTDYDKFVSANPDCGEPDENGVSKITVDGKVRSHVTRCGRYALLSGPQDDENLARMARSIKPRTPGLTEVLGEEELKMAAESPIWLYANVKGASAVVKPMIQMGLGQMKSAIQKSQKEGPGGIGDPQGIIDFYAQIIDFVLGETHHVSAAISPSGEKLDFSFGMTAVPNTTMAKIISAGTGPRGDHRTLLGYLGNEAALNVAADMDSEGLKIVYAGLFDLLGKIGAEHMPEDEISKLKDATVKLVDAMGDSLAFSFTVPDKGDGPFSVIEVFKVKDERLFNQAIDEQLRLMEQGAFNKIYKAFGIEMDFKVTRDVGTYEGVKIDSARLTFDMGQEGSPEREMVEKIWGEGIEYRWAVVGGHCVYAIGDRADREVRRLIDRVKAGGPKRVRSEIRKALASVPDSEKAEMVGTFNYVRMLKMVLGMMAAEGVDVDADLKSSSNIAFAASGGDGRMMMRMVVPKEHIVELKSAFETLQKHGGPRKRQER